MVEFYTLEFADILKFVKIHKLKFLRNREI